MRGRIAVRGEHPLCWFRPRRHMQGGRMIRLRGTVGLPALRVAVTQARRWERDALAAYWRDQAAGRDEDPSDIFEARFVVDQARKRLARAEGRTCAALCARPDREDAVTGAGAGGPDPAPSYLQELSAWLRRVVTPRASRPRHASGEGKR